MASHMQEVRKEWRVFFVFMVERRVGGCHGEGGSIEGGSGGCICKTKKASNGSAQSSYQSIETFCIEDIRRDGREIELKSERSLKKS